VLIVGTSIPEGQRSVKQKGVQSEKEGIAEYEV
jgi:hypothetical protein